ncbi:MAG TPA: hypothetical protein VNT75_15305 [Symbiobacteriaceae bacterium]|nr:hypothetical protein [Symbiobacteriaceae bacterium]
MQQLPQLVIEALQEFHRIAAEVPLWPGYRPETTPLVLHGPESAFLVGHPAPLPGYTALEPICGRTVHVGPRHPDMNANTAHAVGGVLCALAMLPHESQGAAEYARLLLHECFHAHQDSVMKTVPKPDPKFMALYPENDPANNALAVAENRLLVAALGGDAEAPARFLAVRLHRHGRYGEGLRVYETRQEYNEGTPTYIEVQAGQPLSALTDRLLQCNIGAKWAGNYRFYATGMALALLLDRRLPDWKERLARGRETLQELLAATVAQPLPDVGAVLAEAGYPELLAAEEAREVERRRRIDELLAQLEPGAGGYRVEIEIGRAPGCGWNPSAVMVVRPGLRLHPGFFRAMGHAIRIEIQGLCLEDRERQIAVVNLPESPVVTGTAPFRFEGPGLKGEAPAGRIEGDGNRFRICIG